MTSLREPRIPLYAAAMFHSKASSLPCHILMNRQRLDPCVRTTEPELTLPSSTTWKSSPFAPRKTSTPSLPTRRSAAAAASQRIKKRRLSKHRRNHHPVISSKEELHAMMKARHRGGTIPVSRQQPRNRRRNFARTAAEFEQMITSPSPTTCTNA
jgi:hypothetical protein